VNCRFFCSQPISPACGCKSENDCPGIGLRYGCVRRSALAIARSVSLSVTFALLVVLGIGRGVIGHRRILPTIAETIGIAAAAALAGLAIGKLIS